MLLNGESDLLDISKKKFQHSMLTFLSENSRSNLIIFIHGFVAGKATWIVEQGYKSILTYLQSDQRVTDKYDFAIFDYHTHVVSLFQSIKKFMPVIGVGKSESNNPIKDIAEILQSEIKYNCRNYDTIVLITHSMGGLVAKSYILGEIKANRKLKVKLYVSVAVPHRGTDLATLAKLISKNVQIENLNPLSETINTMADDWIYNSKYLPDTIYLQGKNDQIVPNVATIGIDAREKEIVFSSHDHFSIVRPENETDIIISSIKWAILELLKDEKTIESSDEKDDKELLEKHAVAFERPAFRVSCVYDLSLHELSDAIDDTQAAINTGKLYDRNGRLIDNYYGSRQFKTELYKNSFKEIQDELTELKFNLVSLKETFGIKTNDRFGDRFGLLFSKEARKETKDIDTIQRMIKLMNKVDVRRNNILNILNNLPLGYKFKLIELSFDIIKRGGWGINFD